MFKFTKEEWMEEIFRQAKERLSGEPEEAVDEYLKGIDFSYEFEGLLKDEAYNDTIRGEEFESPIEQEATPFADQIVARYPLEWVNQ